MCIALRHRYDHKDEQILRNEVSEPEHHTPAGGEGWPHKSAAKPTAFSFIDVYHNNSANHKVTLQFAGTKENVKEAAPVLLSGHNWAVECCTRTGLQSCDQCYEDEQYLFTCLYIIPRKSVVFNCIFPNRTQMKLGTRIRSYSPPRQGCFLTLNKW